MNKEKPVVLAAVDDLFFSARIETVARHMGIRLELAVDSMQLEEWLRRLVPDLIILDLNSSACRPIQAIRRIKTDPRLAAVPTIGFFPHVQVGLEGAAREAGCDRVVPRSKFAATLPEILAFRG